MFRRPDTQRFTAGLGNTPTQATRFRTPSGAHKCPRQVKSGHAFAMSIHRPQSSVGASQALGCLLGASLYVPEARASPRASGCPNAVTALFIHLLASADAEGRLDLERPSTAPARASSPSRRVRGLTAGSSAHVPTYKCGSHLPCTFKLTWAAAVLCVSRLCTLDTAVSAGARPQAERGSPCRAYMCIWPAGWK